MRSEVQVFPGPPLLLASSAGDRLRDLGFRVNVRGGLSAFDTFGIGCGLILCGRPIGPQARMRAANGFASGLSVRGKNGAIAQLGERVLCKHEVVGSIPSGSTKRF